MPNREFMLELIEALESGQYKKGKGCLRTENNEYCCLGVACDLMAQKGIGEWDKKPLDDDEEFPIKIYYYHDNQNNIDSKYPPKSMQEKMGFKDEQFVFKLANINDQNTTFAPVIAAIKAKLQEEGHA